MRIRDKKPKNLEQALRIALLAEANTVERVIVETVEAPARIKKYRARSAIAVDEATVSAVMSESPGKIILRKGVKKCVRYGNY